MATFFREDEIEEYRQCFFFHIGNDGKGSERTPALKPEELKSAMRSLGLCPTLDEIRKYIKQHGGKVTLADFLEVLYKHKQVEHIHDDILEGFRVHDVKGKKALPEKDVRWMLQNFGERLSSKEVDQLLREGQASSYGNILYNDFVKNICHSREIQAAVQTGQQDRQKTAYSQENKNSYSFNHNEPRPDY